MPDHNLKEAVKYLAKRDNTLSRIIKINGIINLTPHKKYFIALLRAIIGQQLSMYAANTINERFMKYFKNKPEPALILQTEDPILRSLGLSGAKVKYVKDLSHKIQSGEISLKGFGKKSNELIISELTKVHGIGIWSVHMFLIFTLGRLDVLPHSDLGIRKAIMRNYRLKKMPDENKIHEIAKKNNWHPYYTVASLFLWRSLNNTPSSKK
jgi:DNA-3-methyladenine glycosylase II